MSEDVFNNSTINNYYLGDFNGDGLTDFVVTPKKTSYTSNDKWKLYFSEDSLGLGFAFITEGNLDSEFKGFYVANNDGDRKDDIFWKNVTAGSVNFLNYTGNNYTDFGRGDTIYDLKFLGADASTYLMPGDFNGDGISDYLVLYSSLHLLNAIVNGTSKNGISFSNPDDVRIIDFDGDGRQEVLVIDGNNSIIYQYSSSSQSFSTIYTSATFPTNSYRIYPSDFNGDKKTDLLTWKSGTGWQIYFSTGTGFALSGSTPPMTDTDPEGSLADNNYYVSDFNGDGKSDVLEAYKYSTSSILNVFYSIGDGIFSEEIYNYSKSSINQDYFKFGDFNGDGKHDIFFYDYSQSSNSVNLCLFHKDELKNMVECIANGLNYKTKIIYNRLNKGAPFYGIINYDSEYPVYDYKGSYYAVSSIECDNGTGGTINQVYLWEKAKIHRQGRGFLGFSQETITDTAHYSRSLKNFNINPTYYNRYLSEEVVFNYFPGWVLDTLSKITYTDSVKYFGSTSIFPYVSQTVNQDLLLKNTVTTTNRYDDYGNLTGFKVMYQNDEDGHVVEAVKSITNDFEQYGNYGIPNKITGVIDSSQYTGQSVYVRETEFSYNNKGNLTSSTTDPSKSKAVTTTYSYNDFGLPTEVSISSSGLTRTTSMTYDPTSRFITETTNPAGQISEKSYDSKTGNVLTETGIDYLTTQFVYDGFGRLIETITPQSKHIYTTTEWDTLNNGGANSLFYIISDADSIPYTKIYYDILGRELKSETEGINGIVYQEKVYKSNGYLSQKSRPHLSPESVKWNYFDYDSNGRLIKDSTSFHDFKYNYSDKTTTIFRPNSEYKTIFKNSIGNTIRVEMPESTSTEYTYHSSGQVKTIQASGTLVSNYYDEYGFIDSTYNTNSGKLIYNHNAFRELTSQTDANGNNLTFQYDVLGRLITKTDHDGTTSYFYRSSGNGIGQIDSIIGPNDVSQSYGYDSFGRLNQFTERIPNDQDFATSYTYDGWGNNTSITYPSGITIKNIYTNGYLTEIKKSDNTSIWTLDEVNGVGQPKQFTLGNSNLETNFTYDFNSNLLSKITGDREQIFWFEPEDKGSLTSRGYQLNDSTCLYENFGYDPLDRLNITYFNNNPSDTVQYQDNGNISYRSGVGNYSYITHTNFLERITNYSDTTYTEDQNISYTANNMPSSISQSPYELQFIYGPDDQRIKTIHTEEGDTIKTKYFLPAYEKVVTDSTTREFNYIYSPYGLIAIIVKSDSSENMYYTETDHLGSIIGLINSNGTYAERYAYDAWGQRRNPDDWSYDSIPDHVLIDRGFTGHEHLDEFGLINMNGRMYDPYIGRFLSVDPFIQFPDNAQNFNGYAYCLNNPLSYTDPSGMVLEPRINPADAGYSFNPEAAAWLANYYAQSFGGGGGGSGGVNTVTGFWDSHASTSGILGYRWEGDKRIDNATGKIVGVRNDGHYEKVISQNNGTIHGNRLNNESDPNLIDEVSVEYKWVWDVPILSQSGFGDFSSRFSIDFQGDSKLTIGVQAGGNVGGFGGQYGIFGNLCSVTLIGNEGKKLIYPTSQQSGFSQINQGLSGGLIVGAGISHTFNGSFEGYGYANDSYLYLGWLSNKKGIFGITYSHSAEGNTINIGINLQIALILGFEGSYNLRIKW